jgi:hypothetical protein
MCREVTIIEPEHDADDTDGFFPKGPASVCVEGPPQRQCYTAPKEFGNSPTVAVVQLKRDMPARAVLGSKWWSQWMEYSFFPPSPRNRKGFAG